LAYQVNAFSESPQAAHVLGVTLWNSNDEFETIKCTTKSHARFRQSKCSRLAGEILILFEK